jgi:hypothetical protein
MALLVDNVAEQGDDMLYGTILRLLPLLLLALHAHKRLDTSSGMYLG